MGFSSFSQHYQNVNIRHVSSKKIILFIFILLGVTLIGTSLALWQIVLRQNDSNTITTSCFKVEYTNETDAINLNDAVPLTDEEGKKLVPYSFTLTNTCNTKADYVINLETLSQGENILKDEYIKANLVKGTDEVFLNKLTVEYENLEKVIKDSTVAYMLDQGTLEGKESLSYSLRLWIDSDANNIEEMMDRVFASKITVTANYVPKETGVSLYDIVKEQAVLDNTKSEFVTNETGINFASYSSDTNGKGVYTIADTASFEYPVHYFRGAVTNNNVKFAGLCWKIVRTTETGGVKLIYNGKTDSEGRCTIQEIETTQIGTSKFNVNDDSADYVGYMYPETTNENDSTIKTAIDEWYSKNMTGYTKYLEDTVWCNDRSVYNTDSNHVYYGTYGRQTKPSIECPNDNDKFTVSIKNGNGKLTYPVALLTADEARLAGNISSYSVNNYLKTGWVISPYFTLTTNISDIVIISPDILAIQTSGSLAPNGCKYEYGVRPSISLANKTMVSEESNGTPNNPYVVLLNK